MFRHRVEGRTRNEPIQFRQHDLKLLKNTFPVRRWSRSRCCPYQQIIMKRIPHSLQSILFLATDFKFEEAAPKENHHEKDSYRYRRIPRHRTCHPLRFAARIGVVVNFAGNAAKAEEVVNEIPPHRDRSVYSRFSCGQAFSEEATSSPGSLLPQFL
jgi:hypothetical protein